LHRRKKDESLFNNNKSLIIFFSKMSSTELKKLSRKELELINGSFSSAKDCRHKKRQKEDTPERDTKSPIYRRETTYK